MYENGKWKSYCDSRFCFRVPCVFRFPLSVVSVSPEPRLSFRRRK